MGQRQHCSKTVSQYNQIDERIYNRMLEDTLMIQLESYDNSQNLAVKIMKDQIQRMVLLILIHGTYLYYIMS